MVYLDGLILWVRGERYEYFDRTFARECYRMWVDVVGNGCIIS